MARTDATAVKAILLDQYDTVGIPSLSAFIDTATALVDWLEDCDGDNDDVLSATMLERIEAYLAAHFYLLADPTYESKKTGDASAKHRGKTETGLKSTLFGQAALNLDLSGCLSKRDSGTSNRLSLSWLGTAYT